MTLFFKLEISDGEKPPQNRGPQEACCKNMPLRILLENELFPMPVEHFSFKVEGICMPYSFSSFSLS